MIFRVGFRIRSESISESFLWDIIGSLTHDSIGRVLEFTTVPDHRKPIRAYGFLIELEGEIGVFMFSSKKKTSHGSPVLFQDEILVMPSQLSKTS